MKEEYRILDEAILVLEKQLEHSVAKRASLRKELETLSIRDESL